jgi:hypothetical protein
MRIRLVYRLVRCRTGYARGGEEDFGVLEVMWRNAPTCAQTTLSMGRPVRRVAGIDPRWHVGATNRAAITMDDILGPPERSVSP